MNDDSKKKIMVVSFVVTTTLYMCDDVADECYVYT